MLFKFPKQNSVGISTPRHGAVISLYFKDTLNMYRHKKCRYVCGFVPLRNLNITKESIIFDMAKKKAENICMLVSN